MVAVDDVLTDSLAVCVRDFFDPSFSHPFLDLQTVSVPEDEKPIPKRWIEDVEIGMDGDFAAEEAEFGDVQGEGPKTRWTAEEARKRLKDALARLDLREDLIAHPDVHKMSKSELGGEKRRVKQELKRYDAEFRRQFKRLPTHTEKEPMRPLYVYYRRLKTMITQAEHGRGGGRQTGTIGSDDEGLGLRLGHRESLASINDVEESPANGAISSRNEQIAALEARISTLQSEKAGVRVKLQAFQEKFVVEHNRKIRFHKDILPIERQYRMYKNLKEEISKTETQLRNLISGD